MALQNNLKKCLETINSVRNTLDVIGGKWKLAVIISIAEGNDRFKDIQASIPGISSRVLSKELKDIEIHQLVTKTTKDGNPFKSSYNLKTYAGSLTAVISAMKDWGLNHQAIIKHGSPETINGN